MVNQTPHNSQQKNDATILPRERVMAINVLLKSTQNLIDIAEREAQFLAQNDMMNFYILQDEKAHITNRYEKLSSEFRERIVEFRGVDRSILERLEKTQIMLGEKTAENNVIVASMHDRAKQKTQSSLVTVQALAQQYQVNIDEQPASKHNGKGV